MKIWKIENLKNWKKMKFENLKKMKNWKIEELKKMKVWSFRVWQIIVKTMPLNHDQNIEFFCSVFYPEGVDYLESLGVKKYKIASRTCLLNDKYSLETLEKIAKTRKPIIISMGMGGNKKRITKIFSKNKITFCYCISEYPAPFKKIKWKKAIKYDGFSDHSIGIVAPFLFGLLKRERFAKRIIIEKHVKLKNSKGPDASTSITTEELKQLSSNIRIIEKFNMKKYWLN